MTLFSIARRPCVYARERVRASVLLEVLLALILFAAAAAIVTTSFNSSMTSLERQKLGLQALNLAASVLAEVQLGILPANSDSSRPFEPPFADWTWESVTTPTDDAGGTPTDLTRIEVIVRHQKSPTVQRLAQVVHLQLETTTNSPSAILTPER